MTRMTLSARVGADGVLKVPLGAAEANQEVRVTIEPALPAAIKAHGDYLDFLRGTAGAWQGDFQRPEQGDYEVRDPM